MPKALTRDDALAWVRSVAMALPEVTEKLSHGAPSFFVRKAPQFLTFTEGDYYLKGSGTFGLWCPAPDGVQEEVVRDDPDRFFVPPYVGHRGWIGVRLDIRPDWDEVEAVITEAYRTKAPAKLLTQLDAN